MENPVTSLKASSSRGESALYHIAGGNYLKSSLISRRCQAVPVPAAGRVWATPQALFCPLEGVLYKPQQKPVFA